MTQLLRATSLIGKPVVTLGGESPLEIKDVVFDTSDGHLVGFTLRQHGFLGKPVAEGLAFGDVHGLGPDAVIIEDTEALRSTKALETTGGDGDVIGNRVMTENGTDIGEVIEVVVSSGSSVEVVGFEVEAVAGLSGDDDHNVFIPLPDTVSISDRIVIVPDATTDYVRDDLTGFGGAVEDFRNSLSGRSS